MKHQHKTCHNATSLIELRVLISNGARAQDTRLKFEFPPNPAGIMRVWLMRLPTVKNPNAFVTQVKPHCYELRLDVFTATQPLEILNYTPESVAEWLDDVFNDSKPPTTELLILANQGKFTISLHQPS